MTGSTKQNVAVFNDDVSSVGGYQYTRESRFSSIVSNRRLTDVTEDVIRSLSGVQSVLDAGCGDGTYTNELRRRLPHLQFAGFDPACVAVAEAQKRFPECRFSVGDLLDKNQLPAEQFDLVIIRGVIHHLPTQEGAVANAASLGRYVLIIEPNGNNPILKLIEKFSDYHIRHEEQSFSSRYLKRICVRSGLRVTRLFFVGFVPFFFPTIPSRIIHFFQPLLERIPGLARFLGGQIVILAERVDAEVEI
jgi:SAM-dependent methyltransferase